MNGQVRQAAVMGAALAALVVAACSKDASGPSITDPGSGTAVVMKGTLAGGTLSGDIDITLSAAASPTVSGCVYLKTATCVAATGTYTVASKALAFTTTSPALSFSG